MCKPLEQGGLGIRSLKASNKALLNKWLWRFGVHRETTWRGVVAAKYGEERFGWASRSPRGVAGCSVWKGICKGLGSFFRYARFWVNNGERVRFWHDPWCGVVLLYFLFPSCYSVAKDKGVSLNYHMTRIRVYCSWNIQHRGI